MVKKIIQTLRDSTWVAPLLAILGWGFYIIQAWTYAHIQAPLLDEGGYLYIGDLFIRGVIHPFQDFGRNTSICAPGISHSGSNRGVVWREFDNRPIFFRFLRVDDRARDLDNRKKAGRKVGWNGGSVGDGIDPHLHPNIQPGDNRGLGGVPAGMVIAAGIG